MNQLTPVQTVVLSYVNGCSACACMADMCAHLEQTTRYVGYTLERAALELVEAGVLVQDGNLLMVNDKAIGPRCGELTAVNGVWYKL